MKNSSGPKDSHEPIWSLGDYATIGTTLQIVAEQLCEAVDLRGSQNVLDVATGSGNAAIAASRRSCVVTGIDYALPLLRRGQVRASAEGVSVSYVLGNAENLPFVNDSFDVVLSTFGIMFAPSHRKAAKELLRVCRPGGTVGMANWTPEGVFGDSGKVVAAFIAPAPDAPQPSLWGSASYLSELFGNALALNANRQKVMYRYPSVEHYLGTLKRTYPPLMNTFQKLDATDQETFTKALRDLYQSRNEANDGTFVMAMEYLEVVGRKV